MIHNCNNRYLPEKYTLDFLFKHYEGFPSLAYIAEDENSNLVGYAIGRVKLANELRKSFPTNAVFLGNLSYPFLPQHLHSNSNLLIEFLSLLNS